MTIFSAGRVQCSDSSNSQNGNNSKSQLDILDGQCVEYFAWNKTATTAWNGTETIVMLVGNAGSGANSDKMQWILHDFSFISELYMLDECTPPLRTPSIMEIRNNTELEPQVAYLDKEYQQRASSFKKGYTLLVPPTVNRNDTGVRCLKSELGRLSSDSGYDIGAVIQAYMFIAFITAFSSLVLVPTILYCVCYWGNRNANKTPSAKPKKDESVSTLGFFGAFSSVTSSFVRQAPNKRDYIELV